MALLLTALNAATLFLAFVAILCLRSEEKKSTMWQRAYWRLALQQGQRKPQLTVVAPQFHAPRSVPAQKTSAAR